MVCVRDAAADCQSKTGSLLLRRKKWIEDAVSDRLRYPRSGIFDLDENGRRVVRVSTSDTHCQFTPVSHRLNGILEEIEEKLLKLIRVDCDKRRWVEKCSADSSSSLFELTTQQRERIHDWFADIRYGGLVQGRNH